jgi:prephenate dehydrogenase
MTRPHFKKIVIFGAGLIGGSFALALRRANAVDEVVGFGRSAETLKEAKRLGIIDRVGEKLEELKDADLVLLATPVGQMEALMGRIAPHLGAHTLVTDGGSTKCDVVKYARKKLKKRIANFIPAHPIAGAEKSGATAAVAVLYVGKKVVLTPLPENSKESVLLVRKAWELCGAHVHELTPEEHDGVFAAVSHLPHLLSYALVHDISQRDDRDLLMSFAASGFRDFTRIAASSPEMWRDICLANREALLKELKQYADELYVLYRALEKKDADILDEVFTEARKLRANWSPQ